MWNLKIFVKFIVMGLGLMLVSGQMDEENKIDKNWTNEVTFGENFNVKWVGNNSAWLLIEMSAPTKGYVALGFSPDGGMNNSDIIMGWVDSTGKAYLKDMHGIGNTKPVEDPQQNCELIEGEETENFTRIIFRRRWRTCDEVHDTRVDETLRLIWAYNKEDPKLADDDGVFRPPYHFTSRGAGTSDDMKSRIRIPDIYISAQCDIESQVKDEPSSSSAKPDA